MERVGRYLEVTEGIKGSVGHLAAKCKSSKGRNYIRRSQNRQSGDCLLVFRGFIYIEKVL